MSDSSGSDRLAVPWIVVIILSVAVAALSVYLFTSWRRKRVGGRGGRRWARRPATEWYDISSDLASERYQPPRRPVAAGLSPVEPRRTRWNA